MQSIRDIEYDNFKSLCSRHFSPKVYVAASEKAKAICHKNLLTPAEFLRPFGYFRETNTRYWSMDKEKQLPMNSFHLNFVDAVEFEAPKKETVEIEVKNIINNNAPENLEKMSFHTEDKNILCEQLCRINMPWFHKVTDSIFSLTKYQFDMSFLDHPWHLTYLISSKEVDPSQEVRKLVNDNLTRLNGIFATNQAEVQQLPRSILIIYEYSSDEGHKLDVAQKIQNKLLNEFSNFAVKILIINTAEDDKSYETWEGHLHPTYHYPKDQIDYLSNDVSTRGRYISRTDKDMIRNHLYDILLNKILPYVSNKLRILEGHVSKKKGFANSFKKFFGGSTKVETGDRYSLNQDEIYQRNLSDLYFLLEDYDNAYSNYKFFSGEIKGKSARFFTNATEMQNVCALLTERGTAKKDLSFKKCFESYYLEIKDGHKFAARAIIFQIYFCILTNSREEAQLLMEGAKNLREYLPIVNCIFYEQFAMMYLRCEPIWPRKYAFSMVLAGFTYNQASHRKYGQLCYYLANTLYHDISWSMLQEHVNTVLGKNSFQNNESLESIRYFRKALENISQNDTPERHAALIKEAFSVISQIQAEKIDSVLSADDVTDYYEEIIKFPFPKVIDEGFDITIEDDYYNFINDRKTNKIFEGVSQQDFLRNADSEQLWFNMGKRLTAFILKRPEVSRFEPYDELSLRMMDCLYISDKIKLLEKMSREAFIGEDIIINIRVDNPYKIPLDIKDFRLEYDLIETSLTGEPITKTLESKKEDFTLTESEQKYMQIIIKPDREGVIKIRGLRWKIDCIDGKHNFHFKKQYINQIRVSGALGQVTAKLNNLKNQICYGETSSFELSLHNNSNVGVEKVYITNSYPEIVGFENRELGGIEANQTLNVSFIARGSLTGIFEVRFLAKIYYTNGKTRYYRITVPIEVQSSFIPKYFTTPCFDKRIISLQFVEVWSQNFQKQVALLDKDGGLVIEQIILLTDKWKLVETGMHKPIYRKEDNFLHCYVEKTPGENSAPLQNEDLYKLTLKEDANLLQVSKLNEPTLEFKALVDFFTLTFKKFKTMQNMIPKSGQNQDTISLAVLWRFTTPAQTRRGVHFLYKIPLSSSVTTVSATQPGAQQSSSSSSKKLFDDLPVQLRIIAPNVIKHNFSLHPTCSVPIKLRLSNVTGSQVLSFRVETLNSDLSMNPREKTGSKYFVWQGVTDLEVVDLKPTVSIIYSPNNLTPHDQDNCTLDFNLMFFEPGVYDISRFRFNFYVNKRSGELAKNISQSDLVSSQNYERILYTSEKDQCLLEITSS